MMFMQIKRDFELISKVGKAMVSQGLAEISAFSLDFCRYFSEEEKRTNLEHAKNMDSKEYGNECARFDKFIYNQLLLIATKLDEHYDIHQISSEKSTSAHYQSDWDLFFYSNRGWNKKSYYDYMKISFNEKRLPKQNLILLGQVVHLLKNISAPNVLCTIRYQTSYHTKQISEVAEKIFKNNQNRFVTFNGMTGRIRRTENGYGFFKKYSRKKYLPLEDIDLISIGFCA